IRRMADTRPKYELVSELLAGEDLSMYDYIVVVDDDILLPGDFLDSFLAAQRFLDFGVAQPARTSTSYIGLPIVEQQRGVFARRTLLVQAGPVVSFHQSVYHLVFPFDLTSPTGLGYESVWAYQLQQHGQRMGIVDAVPVDHSFRKPATLLDWDRSDVG